MLKRLWNYFLPFAVMKDASRGSLAERAAAFRHNCRMRGCLATYIQRWLISGAVALLLCAFFDTLTPHESRTLTLPVLLTTCVAIFATLAACAVFVLSYAYAALSYHATHFRDGA